MMKQGMNTATLRTDMTTGKASDAKTADGDVPVFVDGAGRRRAVRRWQEALTSAKDPVHADRSGDALELDTARLGR